MCTTAQCDIPEDYDLQQHCSDNLKYQMADAYYVQNPYLFVFSSMCLL